MIDIHSHILNNVDDGSQSIEESLFLISNAIEEGITSIICTPHYIEYSDYNMKKDEVSKYYNILNNIVKEKKLPINLYLGSEIKCEKTNIMDYFDNNLVSTLNNSRYILFEISLIDYCVDLPEVIYDIIVSGYIPILAHPERCIYFQHNPDIIYKLVKIGCLIQINQDSILGENGNKAKKIALLLLKHKIVHFVASDGHNKNRLVSLKDSYNSLNGKISDIYLQQIFETNGQNVIDDKIIKTNEYSKIIKKSYLFGLYVKFV